MTTDRNLFVTVGTTKFDDLVQRVVSPVALDWMVSQGFTSLTIQYGRGEPPKIDEMVGTRPKGLSIQSYDFKASLDADMDRGVWTFVS